MTSHVTSLLGSRVTSQRTLVKVTSDVTREEGGGGKGWREEGREGTEEEEGHTCW